MSEALMVNPKRMTNPKSKPLLVMVAAGLLLLLGACSKSNTPTTETSTEQKPAAVEKVDPATAATITGTVKYTGPVPKPVRIDMSQDPACKGTNMAEPIVAENGDLADAFVYIKEGLAGRNFAVPQKPAVIDQQNCKYHPEVLGVMTGQKIEIRNDDTTTHNIHPTPQDNREWNESQAPNAPPLEKSFAHPELMMQVRCNQHPWMKMYVNVVSNPFFAVTDSQGKFEITGLPPGDYTLAVVHDRLGEQTQKITVGPKESKTADFTYTGAASEGM
jgi:plastocyanin